MLCLCRYLIINFIYWYETVYFANCELDLYVWLIWLAYRIFAIFIFPRLTFIHWAAFFSFYHRIPTYCMHNIKCEINFEFFKSLQSPPVFVHRQLFSYFSQLFRLWSPINLMNRVFFSFQVFHVWRVCITSHSFTLFVICHCYLQLYCVNGIGLFLIRIHCVVVHQTFFAHFFTICYSRAYQTLVNKVARANEFITIRMDHGRRRKW